MSVRHADVLGLHAVERAGVLRAAVKRGAGGGTVRVGVVALGVIPRAAVGAGAAGDRGGHDHAIAFAQIANVFADLFDDAHSFVSEDRAGLHAGQGAANHVQVRTADGARRQAHDRVRRLLDLRLFHIVEPDVADPVKNDCFHLPVSLPL
jgi:hypothetical protein